MTHVQFSHAGPYALRGFVYQAADTGKIDWSATLVMGAKKVCRLEVSHAGAIDVQGLRFDARAELLTHLQAIPSEALELEPEATVPERLQAFIFALGAAAYADRRLMLMAAKHTLYRLKGDPEGAWRYLVRQPYTLAFEGMLRLVHGPQLETVLRPARQARTLQLAA